MYDGKYEIFAWKYFCALLKLKKIEKNSNYLLIV